MPSRNQTHTGRIQVTEPKATRGFHPAHAGDRDGNLFTPVAALGRERSLGILGMLGLAE